MKYKLIKEYPGSPDLGTLVEKNKLSKSYFYRCGDKNLVVLDDHVENNPEYWYGVNDDIWYVVSKRDYQESNMLFQAWTVYSIGASTLKSNGVTYYFKTEEEAEEFILYNKPCLSYNDISFSFTFNTESKDNDLHFKVYPDYLKKLVKRSL